MMDGVCFVVGIHTLMIPLLCYAAICYAMLCYLLSLEGFRRSSNCQHMTKVMTRRLDHSCL